MMATGRDGAREVKLTRLHTMTILPIKVTSFSLSKTSLNFTMGDGSQLLSVKDIAPWDATYQAVTWTSSNESVARVDGNGNVTPVGVGGAAIRAMIDGVVMECAVVAKAKDSPAFPADMSGYTKGTRSQYAAMGLGYMFQDTSKTNITSKFGPRGSTHYGTDFSWGGVFGTPIIAVSDGRIVYKCKEYEKDDSGNLKKKAQGNCIAYEIDRTDPVTGKKMIVTYMHMRDNPQYSNGQGIKKGEIVGYVGNTGEVQGSGGGYHLHMEVTNSGTPMANKSYNNHISAIYFYPNARFTGDTTIWDTDDKYKK